MPEEEKEPTETILKKVTLANFYCELYNVNWSDKTIDFYWADHPKANPKAIPVEGSLRVYFLQVEGMLFALLRLYFRVYTTQETKEHQLLLLAMIQVRKKHHYRIYLHVRLDLV